MNIERIFFAIYPTAKPSFSREELRFNFPAPPPPMLDRRERYTARINGTTKTSALGGCRYPATYGTCLIRKYRFGLSTTNS